MATLDLLGPASLMEPIYFLVAAADAQNDDTISHYIFDQLRGDHLSATVASHPTDLIKLRIKHRERTTTKYGPAGISFERGSITHYIQWGGER